MAKLLPCLLILKLTVYGYRRPIVILAVVGGDADGTEI